MPTSRYLTAQHLSRPYSRASRAMLATDATNAADGNQPMPLLTRFIRAIYR